MLRFWNLVYTASYYRSGSPAATGLNCIIPDTNAFNHLRNDYGNISKFTKQRLSSHFKIALVIYFIIINMIVKKENMMQNKFIQFNSIKYVLERYYKINFS